MLGVAAVYLTGAVREPAFLDSQPLSFNRVGAAAFAVGVGIFVEFLLKASHPPAVPTTLLVTLGAVEIYWRGLVAVLCGIALMFGESVRWLRLRGPLRVRAS